MKISNTKIDGKIYVDLNELILSLNSAAEASLDVIELQSAWDDEAIKMVELAKIVGCIEMIKGLVAYYELLDRV